MTTIPLLLITGLQVWITAGFAMRKDWPAMVIWLGYALANIGFVWYSLRTGGSNV